MWSSRHKPADGSFTPGAVKRLIHGQPAVAGWSEFAFGQLPVDGRIVPVLGIRRHLGAVQPPTTSGRPLSGNGQIELGTVTLGQLGKKIGDTVRIGTPPFARTVTITGTVTLPSFGVGAADHVSLGRGAMLPEATLLAAVGAGSRPRGPAQSVPVYPSAVAIYLAPGTTGVQRAQLVHRIVSANPDGTPGGSYELRHALAAAVVNAGHLGGQPLALALGLAAAAVLSLALTVLSLVRRRRQELALLKALGMTRGQVRVVIAWQATLTLLIAVAIGGPLGIAGRPAGMAGLRPFSWGRAGGRGPGARAHPRPGRPGGGWQPACFCAGGSCGPHPGCRQPESRVDAGGVMRCQAQGHAPGPGFGYVRPRSLAAERRAQRLRTPANPGRCGPRRGLACPAEAQSSVIALAVGSVTWFTARCRSGAVVVRRYQARGSIRARLKLTFTCPDCRAMLLVWPWSWRLMSGCWRRSSR